MRAYQDSGVAQTAEYLRAGGEILFGTDVGYMRDYDTAEEFEMLRRAGMAQTAVGTPLAVGDLVMDEDAREVTRGGEFVELTPTEFELLRFLMRNPRRVLSKAQILDRVWSYDFGGQANVVELYISYLRKKIDSGRAPMIHTMRGAGYVLKPAE